MLLSEPKPHGPAQQASPAFRICSATPSRPGNPSLGSQRTELKSSQASVTPAYSKAFSGRRATSP